jgi:hypothetical protein
LFALRVSFFYGDLKYLVLDIVFKNLDRPLFRNGLALFAAVMEAIPTAFRVMGIAAAVD